MSAHCTAGVIFSRKASQQNRRKSIADVAAARSERLTRALTQLAGEGRSKALFLAAVREAIAGLTKLAGRDAPPAVYTTLQHVRAPDQAPMALPLCLIRPDHASVVPPSPGSGLITLIGSQRPGSS